MAALHSSLSAAQGLLGVAPSRTGSACWDGLVANPGAGLEPSGIPHAQGDCDHWEEVAGPDFEGYLGCVNEFGGYLGIVWDLSSGNKVTFVGYRIFLEAVWEHVHQGWGRDA